eukprot:jgi/Picsp_1/1968/NSC_05434-R1_set domain protein
MGSNGEKTVSSVVEELREWLEEKGTVFGKVECRLVEGAYRGIFATKDILEDEILVSIPKDLLMGTMNAFNSDPEFKKVCQAKRAELSDEDLLAIHLLHECNKGKKSKWFRYLRTLPRSYCTAASLSDEDIFELQATFAIRVIFQEKEKALNSYIKARRMLECLGISKVWRTRRAWSWAVSCVSSRSMFYPGETGLGQQEEKDKDVPGHSILFPFGDLHNYFPPPPPITLNLLRSNISNHSTVEKICGFGGYSSDTECYDLVAKQHYVSKEQVFLCYGRYNNLDLLKLYGFILDNNPHDVAFIPLENFPAVLQLEHNDACIMHDGNPSFELMRALRLASLEEKIDRQKYAFKILQDEAVSKTSEKTALHILQSALQKTLATLPTSLDDDLSILAATMNGERKIENDDAKMRRSVAIEWRIHYKKCLMKCLCLIEKYQLMMVNDG